MKMKLGSSAVLVAGILAFMACDNKKVAAQSDAKSAAAKTDVKVSDVKDFKSEKDKISYAIGMYFGNTIKRQAVDVDVDTVSKAIKDVVSGTPKLTEQEAQQTIQAMQKDMMAKREAEAKVVGEKNKIEGKAFLSENAKKPGVMATNIVVKTPTGTITNTLQYKVITEGKGATPKATDTVTTHYRGRLINGTEFDSSYKRGQPAEFPVGGVIKGWTEALQMMKVGSKWELYIPAGLAYGERGSPPNIGPDATLIFEIELLGIKTPPTANANESNQAVSGEIIKVPSAEELKKGAKIEVIRPGQTNTPVQINTATPKK